MIKKLLLALALLLPLPAFADATFFYRAEGETLSSPASDFSPDTSATNVGGISVSTTAVKVGTNGLLSTNDLDYELFDSTGICDETQGTLAAWVQFKTAIPASGPVAAIMCLNSANNSRAMLTLGGSQEIRMSLQSSGGTSSNLQTATNGCNFAVDTWYFIVGSWHIANDDRTIACYDSTGALISSNSDLTTDLSASAPGTFDQLRVGNPSTNVNVTWTDNFFVSATYAEPFENFHSITAFAPTYTAGPTNGTFTDTTLPFTFTADQNGTTYAAACTNGQTIATFANLKTGTCSGGAAPGTGTEVAAAAVGDTVTITGLSSGTTYDVYIGHESDIGGQSSISSLADRATTSSSLSLSSTNVTALADGYTIAGTATGSGTLTVEAVACALGDAAPTSNEIEAGQCGGGNAALMNASEVWTTAVANDFALTSANKPQKLDVYFSVTNGTSDSSVDVHLNENRLPRTGFAFGEPTSIALTAIFDLDAYFDPDFAANQDVFEFEDDTNESADCNVAFGLDGDFTLTPVSPGDCDGKQTFNISYEYGASATTGLFTAPASVGDYVTDDLVCNGNSAPIEVSESEDLQILLIEDAAMTDIDFALQTSDPDSPANTAAVTIGTPPVGTTIDSAGLFSGTPTTQDEGGELLQITFTDECGDSVALTRMVYVTDNVIVTPDVVGDTALEATIELTAVRPWLEEELQLEATFDYDEVVAEGDIISQSPEAAANMTALEVVQVVVSLGPAPVSVPATEDKVIFELTDVTGLTQWVDYIPVSPVPGCVQGRYEADGCWGVFVLSSDTGLVPWVDYTPVYDISPPNEASKWTYENDGWIPVDSLTPE